MKSERYEPKQCVESAKESCQYCHNTSLQQIGNEKVCAYCGTRMYSTSGTSMQSNTATMRLATGGR